MGIDRFRPSRQVGNSDWMITGLKRIHVLAEILSTVRIKFFSRTVMKAMKGRANSWHDCMEWALASPPE